MKLYYNGDKCPRCGELTDHYQSTTCRKCSLAYMKEWKKSNATKVKAYQEKYVKSQCNESGQILKYIRILKLNVH